MRSSEPFRPDVTNVPVPAAVEAPHTLSKTDVLSAVLSDEGGLDPAEAQRRIDAIGPNTLPEGKKRGLPAMIAGQFTDFLILLLIGAAVISSLLGEMIDTIAIIVIVALNAVIGVVQEYRAQKAMDALKAMAEVVATVRRGGAVLEVPASELTVGDIVLLDAGRIVPADLRLLEAERLRIAEAALTGESLPIDKQTGRLDQAAVPLGDRTNMAYRGTQVVGGRGVGVVVAVGSRTELGKIAAMLHGTEETKTPLQKRIAQFGRQLGYAALALCGLVFLIGMLRGGDPLTMFLTAVSLAVAAVPEALPAVVTVTLALGARQMVKTHALVRNLAAVETLGSATFICTDKTGTLTLNRMVVERMMVGDEVSASIPGRDEGLPSGWRFLALAMALSNDVAGDEDFVGDPTEIALVRAAREAGYDKKALAEAMPRVAELPFDSERKLMTTVHEDPDGGFLSFTKGAAEEVLARARAAVAVDGSESDLDAAAVLAVVNEWSAAGLRVLAFGIRRLDALPSAADHDVLESDLALVGIVGLVDPPREEAAAAVATAKEAGVVPVMITGDHPATALAIARRLGIAEDESEMMTGSELEAMTLEHFERRVEEVRVYARVAPEQKLKIVQALQDKGEFVGMTGDGVNDAPALKRADIGIAMGITGTDVAKEAADMILLDDNFASIVSSIREGRKIFDNIRKFIKYTMTSNSGEIWTILLAPLLGLPIPLLPIHILWINLVTDGLPGLAFSSEPAERGIMKRPPRAPKESIFADGLGTHLVWVGLLMGGVSLATQAVAMELGLHWQTMVFTVLCFSQMGHALAIRSDRDSLFRLGLRSNRSMLFAISLTVVAQLATIYVPFLRPVFRTEALSLAELAGAIAVSTVVFWAVEIEKWVKRRADARSAARLQEQVA